MRMHHVTGTTTHLVQCLGQRIALMLLPMLLLSLGLSTQSCPHLLLNLSQMAISRYVVRLEPHPPRNPGPRADKVQKWSNIWNGYNPLVILCALKKRRCIALCLLVRTFLPRIELIFLSVVRNYVENSPFHPGRLMPDSRGWYATL